MILKIIIPIYNKNSNINNYLNLSFVNRNNKYIKKFFINNIKGKHCKSMSDSLKDKTVIKKLDPSILKSAIKRNDVDKIVSLISEVDPSELNQSIDGMYTPLYIACMKGRAKIVELLLLTGIDPNITWIPQRKIPLYRACMEGDIKIVEFLLLAGANPNITEIGNETPLYIASQFNHMEIIKLLLLAGGDPNIADESNKTPLYWASLQSHTETVKLLLMFGADPNIINTWDQSLLYLASRLGEVTIVELLLSAGADSNIALVTDNKDIAAILKNWKSLNPNEIDENGKTTLMNLIIKGYYPAFKRLLSQVENINVRDDDGNTALNYAIMHNRQKMVLDLLEIEDINTTIINNENKSSYNYAKEMEKENPNYVLLLKDIWDQQMTSKLNPANLEAKLATLRYYSRKYENFLLEDPEKLSWAEVEDLVSLLNLKASIYDAVRETQSQFQDYSENGGTSEHFIE